MSFSITPYIEMTATPMRAASVIGLIGLAGTVFGLDATDISSAMARAWELLYSGVPGLASSVGDQMLVAMDTGGLVARVFDVLPSAMDTGGLVG